MLTFFVLSLNLLAGLYTGAAINLPQCCLHIQTSAAGEFDCLFTLDPTKKTYSCAKPASRCVVTAKQAVGQGCIYQFLLNVGLEVKWDPSCGLKDIAVSYKEAYKCDIAGK